MVEMSEDDFEIAVGEALDLLPPQIADAMDNVVILIEPEPRPDHLKDAGTNELLGLYEGTPLTERDDWWGAGALPDRILIFRGPILRVCESPEEVAEEVAITVLHEVAHHFGIDDVRLDELGWA